MGSDVFDGPAGHVGQSREDVAEVGVGIDAATAAGFDDGVNDGSAFSGVGLAHEEPVLLSPRSWWEKRLLKKSKIQKKFVTEYDFAW